MGPFGDVDGNPIATFGDHPDHVRAVAFSPDGRLIATAGAGRTVKLWDTRNGKPYATLPGHTAPIQVLAFSRDGRALASADYRPTC